MLIRLTIGDEDVSIENVIFQESKRKGISTVVIWSNGDKTVVTCQPDEQFDPEKGIALCVMKYALGNQGNYNDIFREWIPESV